MYGDVGHRRPSATTYHQRDCCRWWFVRGIRVRGRALISWPLPWLSGGPLSQPVVRLRSTTNIDVIGCATAEYHACWLSRARSTSGDSQRMLVSATKDEEALLCEAVGDIVAPYGAVSELNEYEDPNTVVLSKPVHLWPHAVADIYRTLHGGELGEPLSTEVCYRRQPFRWSDDNSETTWEVSVTSSSDERLVPIYEHWRWSEMYQAAHRVRPVLHPRRIVVTCAIPLRGLRPTIVQRTTGQAGTLERLCGAAERLLEQGRLLCRTTLAEEADMSLSTASRYCYEVVERLDLTVVEILVPSERYPGGRKTQVGTRKGLTLVEPYKYSL
jgi:hypothetical protein